MNTKLDFDLGMKSLSLLRYITDHVSHLSVSVLNRMLNVHDIPLLLTSIIELAPWKREQQGASLSTLFIYLYHTHYNLFIYIIHIIIYLFIYIIHIIIYLFIYIIHIIIYLFIYIIHIIILQ